MMKAEEHLNWSDDKIRGDGIIDKNTKKELVLFFTITLGLSLFVFWGPLALFRIPTISFVDDTRGPVWAIVLFMFNGFVPSLAAILLTWALKGTAGLRQFLKRVIQFNIGWRWYFILVLMVAFLAAGKILLMRLLGQVFDYRLFFAQLGSFLPLILIGPLSEELGWRGYALDRMQTRFNPAVSSFIVGVAWGLWHLPLFYIVGTSQYELHIPFLGFLCGVTALSFMMTWLQNNTHGSLWTAILFHWLYTYSDQVVASGVQRSPLYNWLEFTPYILLALVVGVFFMRQKKTGEVVEAQPVRLG